MSMLPNLAVNTDRHRDRAQAVERTHYSPSAAIQHVRVDHRRAHIRMSQLDRRCAARVLVNGVPRLSLALDHDFEVFAR